VAVAAAAPGQQVGAAGTAPPPMPVTPGAPAPKKKKRGPLLVLLIVLVVLAIGAFAFVLFLYPYLKPMNAYLGRHWSSQPVGDLGTIINASANLENRGSGDWPKAELIMQLPSGSYYCPIAGTEQYETSIKSGGTASYDCGGYKLKNVQTGQQEQILPTESEFENAKFELKVDFANNGSFWVKLRKALGMKTQRSINTQ
jgi:hypothetical protein